jgi:hypothetical protein
MIMIASISFLTSCDEDKGEIPLRTKKGRENAAEVGYLDFSGH